MKLVGFLDILGFSDLVANNSFEQLGKIYKIFESGYKNGVTLNKYVRTSNGIIQDFSDCHIQAIQISDSIIVWTKEETVRSYYDLIITVRELLGHGIFSGLPLRACIHYGEFGNHINFHSEEISTNTFYGKSITTSYKKCESQSWSGGFMTQEAVEAYKKIIESLNDDHLISLTNIDALQRKHFLKLFEVPFKNGETSEEYCINWVNWQNPKKTQQGLIKAFSEFNKSTKSKRVKEIIENTIKFWDSCPERVK
jgi:hypothetical protein